MRKANLLLLCLLFVSACGSDVADPEPLAVIEQPIDQPELAASATPKGPSESPPISTLEPSGESLLPSADPHNAPPPLTVDSPVEEITARVLAPVWETLWLRGVVTMTTPQGGLARSFAQAWLQRGGGGRALATDYLAGTTEFSTSLTPKWLWASDGVVMQTYTLPDHSDLGNFKWFVHPLEMAGPVLEMVFYPRYLTAQDEVLVVGSETAAGREALILDWGAVRLWVDTVSGLVVRMQQSAGEFDPENITQDVQLLGMYYDIQIPSNALLPYLSVQGDRPFSESVFFDNGPVPQGYQVAKRPLILQSVMVQDVPDVAFTVDLYAGGYFLGSVASGQAPLYMCSRSPLGDRMAFIHLETDASGSPIEDGLRWFDLNATTQVYDPLPDIRVIGQLFWSPDGTRLLFSGCRSNDDCHIMIVALPEGEILFEYQQYVSSWPMFFSPDGSQIAFIDQSGNAGENDQFPLIVLDYASGEVVYQGVFDAKTWQTPPDSPLAAWGVQIPRGVYGYDACR